MPSPVKYRNIVDLRLRFRCVFSASLKSGDVVIRRVCVWKLILMIHVPRRAKRDQTRRTADAHHAGASFMRARSRRAWALPDPAAPYCTHLPTSTPPAYAYRSGMPMHIGFRNRGRPSRIRYPLDPTCIGGLLDHPTPCLIRLNIPHTPHISDRPMRESTALRGLKACACNEARNRGALLPCQLS